MTDKPKLNKPKTPDSAGSFLRSSKVKLAAFVGGGLLALFLIARVMGGGPMAFTAPRPKPIDTTPGTNNLYDRTLSDRVESIHEQNQHLRNQVGRLESQLKTLEGEQDKLSHQEAAAARMARSAKNTADNAGAHSSGARGSGPQNAGGFNPAAYKVPPPPSGGYVPPPPPASGYADHPSSPSSSSTAHGKGPTPLVIANANATGAAKQLKVTWKRNPYAGYLPAGSFAKAALLTGVDAGTSDYTRSNPQPILMRVQNDAQLPGAARYGIRACFLIGSGYGNLSAERVYVRLTRISCLSQTRGAIVSSPIQGYVVDSDGVLGMRGRVINRTGALLAKALLAGFAQGAAQIARVASQTVTTSSLTGSTTSTIQGSQILRGAGFAGIGNAASLLAKQYIKDAQAIYPVIEVPPGRKATVVVTKGVGLRWKKYAGLYTPSVVQPHDGTIPAPGNDDTGDLSAATSDTTAPVPSSALGPHS